ncbi:hypothetical protein BH11PSE12_BH11PSE12_01490 [soil metagenome]
MNQHTPPKRLAKSSIAIAVMVMGGFGIVAGMAMDEQVPAQAIAAVAVNTPTQGASTWGANPLMQTQAASLDKFSPASGLTDKAYPAVSDGANSQTALAPVTLSAAMMAQMELPASFVPASADGSTENSPFAQINLKTFSSGAEAIAALGDHLNAVAQWYGMSHQSFQQLLLSDNSVHLDRKGRMLHIDAGLAGVTATTTAPVTGTAAGSSMQAATVTTAAATTAASPFPFDQTFKLHTKSGSTRVLYLNFIGQGTNPAFDLDKLPATFSNGERLMIQKIWQRVAEDYAPFDVDITTEPMLTSAGKVGATVLITPQASTAGGYAYLNSFSTFAVGAAPAFCFPNNLANSEKPIAECISHESGHTLGLTHQGANPSTAYYAGQGAGDTGWAPIMGVSYYKNLTQWSKGEYTNANNKQDAYAVMSRQGLKPLNDDHGNTIAFADALASTVSNGLNNLSASGVIETPGDVDMFRFVAGAGSVSFKVAGAAVGSNLDVALQVIDGNGTVLASANTVNVLSGAISVNLPAQGTYFLSVTGAGNGDPLKTGYSNYGSLGQYIISGTSALANNTSAVASIKTSATRGTGPLTISLDASASALVGGKINSYQWTFGDGTPIATTALVKHTYTKAGVYETVLKIIDSRGATTVTGVKITVS